MKHRKIAALLAFASIVSGCGVISFTPYKNNIVDKDDYQRIEGSGYYKPASYAESYESVYQSYPYYTNRTINAPTTGKDKLLVVPVVLGGETCSSLILECKQMRMKIQNTFFGVSKNTKWESVASFYNKSSFGKLSIEGEVLDWFNTDVTYMEIANDSSLKTNAAKIAREVHTWLIDTGFDIKKYDANGDGFVDAVAFVYAAPSVNSNVNTAFASSFMQATPDVEKPDFKNYMMINQDYMAIEYTNSAPNARTYIHEFGHLIGLPDYYSVDAKQKFGPLGKMDMMDIGLGDHNVFSKMLMNWTRPYAVTGSTTIKLKASQISGECIVLANNWNGSAMDEYVAIELYTPTGLNKYDTKNTYSDGKNLFSLMNKPGIKVLHVDARVGYFKTITNTFFGYVDEVEQSLLDYYDSQGQRYFKAIAHSNTLQQSQNDNVLIRLIERNNAETFLNGDYMSNNSLWQAGDKIDNILMNRGETLNYEIEIISLDDKEAEIKITLKE